jgi:hypothetical protein
LISFVQLEALNLCVGVEAMVFMVHGVSDFTMVPKAFFTSPAAKQFVHLLLAQGHCSVGY